MNRLGVGIQFAKIIASWILDPEVLQIPGMPMAIPGMPMTIPGMAMTIPEMPMTIPKMPTTLPSLELPTEIQEIGGAKKRKLEPCNKGPRHKKHTINQ